MPKFRCIGSFTSTQDRQVPMVCSLILLYHLYSCGFECHQWWSILGTTVYDKVSDLRQVDNVTICEQHSKYNMVGNCYLKPNITRKQVKVDEMILLPALYQTKTHSFVFILLANWNRSASRQVVPLACIISIPSQHVFSLKNLSTLTL
jgi:hypothetical protein